MILFSKIQSSSWLNQLRRLNFSLYSFLARESAFWFIYQPYIWWRQTKRKARGKNPQEVRVSRDTEIVIDGFQGSANGFATASFKQSQMQPVRLAHHLHSPAEIIKAIEQGTPVLLLIREPVGAILSLTSRWPHVSVTQGLQSYIKFYNKLGSYHNGYIISTFEQTTKHLDCVVKDLNAKFDTHFDVIDIAKAQGKHQPTQTFLDSRSQIKQQKKQELAISKNTQLLAEANQIYRQFEAISLAK